VCPVAFFVEEQVRQREDQDWKKNEKIKFTLKIVK